MTQRPVALLLCLLLSSATFAQKPTATTDPLVERVEVRVVDVDVAVSDGDGRPVTGLTAADFEVFEEGKPQAVTGFYAIENSAVRSPSPEEPLKSDKFRRKVILLVDNNSMNKVYRDSALKNVGNFIDNQFAEDYEWAVISVGPNVQTLQPFTTQKSEIHAALTRVSAGATFEIQRQLDRRLLSDSSRAALREQEFANKYDFGETARFQAREQTMRNILSTINAARAAIQTFRAYSAAGGKKLLLLVTGGIEMNTSFSAFDSDSDRNMIEMKRQLERILDLMVREANAANFNIYVVNARGMEQTAPQHDVTNRSSGTHGNIRSTFQAGAYSKGADISDTQSASLTLALGTGGRYLPGNDVGKSLDTVDEETSNFYSLAYTPQHPEDGQYRRIDVRVKKPGLTVRHREGYAALSSEARLEQSLRSPMRFPKEKGSLPVKLKLGLPTGDSKKKRTVPVTASTPIGGITLFPRGDQHVGRVHVYLSIYNEQGDNVGFHHYIQDLSVPSNRLSEASGRAFGYTMNVGLAKGSYSIVVTLRDELSDEVGTGFQDVRL